MIGGGNERRKKVEDHMDVPRLSVNICSRSAIQKTAWALEAETSPLLADIGHLHTSIESLVSLFFLESQSLLATSHIRKALVTRLVGMLEVHIGGRTGTAENSNPILPKHSQGEGSVSVFLGKLVAVEILPSGLTTTHEEEMICPKRRGIRSDQDAIDHHCEGHPVGIDRVAKFRMIMARLSVNPDEKMRQRCSKEEKSQNRSASDEGKEISVIAASNASVEPDTVMILGFDTVVAHAAMMSARGSPEIA
jgi:hypothetical protein